MNDDTTLPMDLNAERATLGAILQNPDVLVALPSLRPAHFYDARHVEIFTAMRAVADRRLAPDVIHVSAELKAREAIERVGGYPYLLSLAEAAPSSYRAPQYAQLVGDHAKKRSLIQKGGRIAAYGYDPGLSADEAISRAQADLDAVDEAATEDMHGAQAMIERWYDALFTPRPALGRGASTGINGLDDYLRPSICGGKLIVVAGYTGTGKSTLSGVMRRALLGQGWQSLTYSGEMLSGETINRDASAIGRLTMGYLTAAAERHDKGLMTDAEIDHLNTLAETLTSLTTYVDDSGDRLDRDATIDRRMTMREIERRALYLRHRNPQPLVVVVDHLGLVASPHGVKGDAYTVVSENARQAKQLAMQAECLVIMPVQLNRQAAQLQRDDQQPELNMLRDSGEIEQSADAVIMLKHSASFAAALEACETQQEREKVVGIVEAYIRKHRNGAKGMCSLMAEFAYYDMKG